jgi:hypothetical protein
MQRCIATVRLGGNMKSTVVKQGVSPAEVLVLRRIHGDDAVVDFKPDGNDRGKAVNEAERLRNQYGRQYTATFPGSHPKLPERFAEIGVDLYAADEAAQGEADKPRRGRPPRGGLQNEVKVTEVTAADVGGIDDQE